MADGTGEVVDRRLEDSHDVKLIMGLVSAIPDQGISRVGNWGTELVGAEVREKPAHEVYLLHQRVGPPGAMTFNSPATVPTRVLATARRDKRANNIFYA